MDEIAQTIGGQKLNRPGLVIFALQAPKLDHQQNVVEYCAPIQQDVALEYDRHVVRRQKDVLILHHDPPRRHRLQPRNAF